MPISRNHAIFLLIMQIFFLTCLYSLLLFVII